MPLNENPGKKKALTKKSLTMRVTRNKVRTLTTHRKVPKVRRLMGKRKRLIRGLIKRLTNPRTKAVKKRVSTPFAKVSASGKALLTSQRAKTLMASDFKILLTA